MVTGEFNSKLAGVENTKVPNKIQDFVYFPILRLMNATIYIGTNILPDFIKGR